MQVRVEHIFGSQANDMSGTLVRTISLVRAKAAIGMKNLACTMRRLGQLGRINPKPGLTNGRPKKQIALRIAKTALNRGSVRRNGQHIIKPKATMGQLKVADALRAEPAMP